MALIVEIKVIPSSGRQKWQLDKNGQIKCYLKNPPEKGKANKELVSFIAESIQCAQRDIEIISGATARKKKIKIHTNNTYEMFLQKLGLETGVQSALF
ncbi:MAG: DUF167 domain-containing protein [Candidatus Babeliales bacterium]